MAIKIVSGGQTGVDRAALDAARSLGVACGGWCPRGRRAEDGRVPARYPLKEAPSVDYAVRTEWNVRDSDATLILAKVPLSGGTRLTREVCKRLKKPCLVVDPTEPGSLRKAKAWVTRMELEVLNVAGPRAAAGYDAALSFMLGLLGSDS